MAISACFTDPYLTILRDDFSLLLLQADDSGDVDEIALSEEVTNKKWLSSCLYCDRTGIFSFSSSATATEKEHSRNDILLFLLSSDSKLFVCELEISLASLNGITLFLTDISRCCDFLIRDYYLLLKESIACRPSCRRSRLSGRLLARL